jgi:hypothetical protein
MAQASVVRKRERSPSFPSIDLESALDKARLLRANEGDGYTPVEAILAQWRYSGKSRSGLRAVSALQQFGLLEDQGAVPQRQARLTPLAIEILSNERPDDRERMAAIREAALRPPLHAQLWEAFGGRLPTDADLRSQLGAQRLTDRAIREGIDELRRTLAFAGLVGGDERAPQSPTPELSPETEGRAIRIPLGDGRWAALLAPFPLTETEWQQMVAALDAIKPALVAAPRPLGPSLPAIAATERHSALTFEAQELLAKVDAGAVPMYTTNNLLRIAAENGIVASSDMTPNEIIHGLRQRR